MNNQEVAEYIENNFRENIAYLEEFQPKLFQKCLDFDNALDNGYYTQKYELVYELGQFDVVELDTKLYLYSQSSDFHTQEVLNSIDYSKSEDVFETFMNYGDLSGIDKIIADEKVPFDDARCGFFPLLNYLKQESKRESNELKNIDKYIFFGTALALHVERVDKLISAKTYLIVEDDLELFRLSLFTCSYANLAKRATLFFSILDNNEEFFATGTDFLKYDFINNHYIKFFNLLSHSKHKRDEFRKVVASQTHLIFFYNALLTQYLKPLEYLKGGYNFLQDSMRLNLETLNSKPYLILGAGPSLHVEIEWLKKNASYFNIVALSAVLNLLEREQIKPDIIVHLDAFHFADAHFDSIENIEFFDSSLSLFSARVPLHVVSKFKKENIFFYETGTHYSEHSLKTSGACVGSTAYQILLKLHAKSIYLLGIDLALDSKTGATHSASHEYAKKYDIKETMSDDDLFIFKHTLFKVDGNLTDKVLTKTDFYSSILSINNSTEFLKKDIEIFNIGQGAKFRDIEPIFSSDISLHVEEMINETTLHVEATKHSKTTLSDIEKRAIKDKIEHTKRLKSAVLEFMEYKHKKENYIEALKSLFEYTCSKDSVELYELSRILDSYYRFLTPHIAYFLQNSEHNNLHVENINSILMAHSLKIIEYYESELSLS